MIAALCGSAAAETLIVPPYPGAAWKKITDRVDDRQTWIEWIPVDQSESDIRDILTEQIFPEQKDADPAAFARDWMARFEGRCAGLKIDGPILLLENGVRTASADVYCVGLKGENKDVDIVFKALAGQEALYVVQREFRRVALPGAVAGVLADRERIRAIAVAGEFFDSKVRIAEHADDPPPAPRPPPPPPPRKWPMEGVTTEDEVRGKLGKPAVENRDDPRHTGEYVLLYEGKDGKRYGFLFARNHVLEHMSVYERTP